MIKKYRTKPIEVEAIQFNGSNINEIEDFIGQIVLIYTEEYNNNSYCLIGIPTSTGIIKVSVGSYIIKNSSGEYHTCSSDLFKIKYEEI